MGKLITFTLGLAVGCKLNAISRYCTGCFGCFEPKAYCKNVFKCFSTK